ncbi:MAG: alcohol dehydrogenase family protein [Pseudomonadota bacterium]
MRAIVLTGHGGLDKLEYRPDWPEPQIGPGEALIRVLACGMNNTDVNTRAGWYSKDVREATTGEGQVSESSDGTWGGAGLSFPRVQGADVCGIVEEVAPGGDASLIGKRVMIDTWFRDWSDPTNMNKAKYFGSEIDGGYAEYTKAPISQIHPVESDLSDAEIATFATSYVTAENMLARANVGSGDSVLIPGASGGVGSALIQLAKRRGAKTIAMASAAKHDQIAPLDPDAMLDRDPGDLGAALADAGFPTVSVVADVVGGPMFNDLLEVMERGGRYTCAGAIAGPIVEMDLRTFYLNDLTFTGATIVPPHLFGDLVGYISAGELKPLLAETWPLEDFHDAQRSFISKKHVGNIVVVP